MAEKLTYMSGDEFIKRVLSGERDFRRVKLEPEYDFSNHERADELREYLLKEAKNLKQEPIDVSYSNLEGVVLKNFHLIYIIAKNTDLGYAVISYSNLSHGNLEEANLKSVIARHTIFYEANLCKTNLEKGDLSNGDLMWANLNNVYAKYINLIKAEIKFAHLEDTNLSCADLENASLHKSELKRVNLEEANLHSTDFYGVNVLECNFKNVEKLDGARNLDSAKFHKIKVTENERKIIEGVFYNLFFE